MTVEDSGQEKSQKRRGSRFPRKMVGLTVIVVALIALSKIFISELTDFTEVSPDVAGVFAYLLIMILLVSWSIWILFFSGRRILVRIVAAAMVLGLPFGFLKIMRPVNDGDVGIVRFEPIWQPKRVLGTEVETVSVPVDLKSETPNDFPQFLGPNRNGDVSNQGTLSDNAVGSDSKIVWKVEIGDGWSGFAARNGYAVTIEQRGQDECITCYNIESGSIQWIAKYPARHEDMMGLGRAGPRSTPTIHNGYVYAVGAMGNLVCLDGSDGTQIWQKSITDILGIEILERVDDEDYTVQYEDSALAWGRAGSPLIVGDVVVVPGGGPRTGDKVTLLAFDLENGELKWKAGEDMIAYGSPSLANLAGRDQIVIVAEASALGFDAKTGEQLWSHPWPGASDSAANCSQVTVLSDNRILLSKGYNLGGETVDIEFSGDKFTATSVTSNPRVLKTKLSNPVIRDGFSYCLSDGFLECTDVSDLSRKWKRRGRFGHGQLLLCGDKLLIHSESGVLYLVQASPDGFEELGKLPTIDGVCWNTICRYGDYVLVRSELEAACIQLSSE